jgi:hypothetical protein
VLQFTPAGALVHSYRVPEPVALAGAGDSAWVEYGGQGDHHVAVRRLHAGAKGRPFPLAAADAAGGYDAPLVSCPDGVYAMSQDDSAGQTLVDRIAACRLAGSVRIGDLGNSVLSCANLGVDLVIQDGASDHLRHPAFSGSGGGRVLAVVRLPRYTGEGSATPPARPGSRWQTPA